MYKLRQHFYGVSKRDLIFLILHTTVAPSQRKVHNGGGGGEQRRRRPSGGCQPWVAAGAREAVAHTHTWGPPALDAWRVPSAATSNRIISGVLVTRRRAGAGIAAAASPWSNDVAIETTRNGPDETVSASVQYRVVVQ
jgi:hypothetical protein